ncbi:unnamed protein product [Cunninghamella blakesleeana]
MKSIKLFVLLFIVLSCTVTFSNATDFKVNCKNSTLTPGNGDGSNNGSSGNGDGSNNGSSGNGDGSNSGSNGNGSNGNGDGSNNGNGDGSNNGNNNGSNNGNGDGSNIGGIIGGNNGSNNNGNGQNPNGSTDGSNGNNGGIIGGNNSNNNNGNVQNPNGSINGNNGINNNNNNGNPSNLLPGQINNDTHSGLNDPLGQQHNITDLPFGDNITHPNSVDDLPNLGSNVYLSKIFGFDAQNCTLNTEKEDYNSNLRIGAVFILLVVSSFGVFIPFIIHRLRNYDESNSFQATILIYFKFFGIGVILSTAFAHMIPESSDKFNSPCLGGQWNSNYHAYTAVFCLIATFIVQGIETFALARLEFLKRESEKSDSSIKHGGQDIEEGENGIRVGVQNTDIIDSQEIRVDNGIIYSAGSFEDEDIVLRNISTFVIEFGFCLHSIIIGIIIGVCTENTFMAIFIAAIFHQFFSGFALGTRINEINTASWLVPTIMSMVFVLSTPVGVAIGIGIRKMMNIPATLLSQGILNAVAAGVLLYNANSFLMSVEINHDKINSKQKFRDFNPIKKTCCLFCMYIGAGIMCALAIWV